MTKTKFKWGFKSLSQEDKNVFTSSDYSKNPKVITLILQNFVTGFYQYAADNKFPVKYNPEIISPILMKIQDYIAARMFVSQLLTAQERSTIQLDNYLKNPEAAFITMTKSGKLLAEEFARLNLIPNTSRS